MFTDRSNTKLIDIYECSYYGYNNDNTVEFSNNYYYEEFIEKDQEKYTIVVRLLNEIREEISERNNQCKQSQFELRQEEHLDLLLLLYICTYYDD